LFAAQHRLAHIAHPGGAAPVFGDGTKRRTDGCPAGLGEATNGRFWPLEFMELCFTFGQLASRFMKVP
jgi:hypothetical protein